jgi:trimeric autotransporter adhesin
MRSTRLVLATLALCVVAIGHGAAQSFQGGLRGTVRDAQGVIPGVTVTLVNQDNGVSRETVSNDVGEYSFPGVNPGTYTIRATVAGFKTFERKDARIGTQQFLTLDLSLEIGAIEETITVAAEAPLIETSNASTGDVLDKRTLETLPSISRMAFLVSNTVPTVTYTGNPHMNRMQDQTEASRISLGGGISVGNNYLLDGYPITDLQNRASVSPSIEMVEDVKVQVHTYDAEMGRTGGGMFNASAKSGTNRLLGGAFLLMRPGALIGENFFLKVQGQPNPPQFWRNAGGGAGGPIVRNKTFFWFAAEGYRDGLTQNGNLHVPTAAEHAGDFSGLTDSSGRPIIIYDPLTTDPVTGARQPFPNNRIPANRINPVGANILKYFPLPNAGNTTGDNGSTNYVAQNTPNNMGQQFSLKLDHHFDDRIALSGVYVHQYTEEPAVSFTPDAPFLQGGQNNRPINVLVLNNTYVMNGSTVLTLRAGYNSFDDITPLLAPFDAHTLGFSPSFADAIPVQRFPALTLTGYQGASYTGQGKTHYYSEGVNGTLTRLAGEHSFKVGGDYRRIGVSSLGYGNSAGNFTFSGQFTGSNATSPAGTSRNAIADLLLGYPTSGSETINTQVNDFVNYYGAYVQDDYRVSPRLTVNYGLRLEHETGLAEADDKLAVGFDPNVVSPLNVTIPAGTDPLNPAARQVKGGLVYANVNGAQARQGKPPAIKPSPRAGIVFKPGANLVLRAGYGMFWAPWNYSPVTSTGYSQTTTLTQNNNVPVTSIDNPFPTGILPPSGNSLGLLSGASSGVSFFDPNATAPRMQQYSADVQRELPGGMSLSLGYVGSRGDHIAYNSAINLNQLSTDYLALGRQLTTLVPNPFFGIDGAGTLATQRTVQLNSLLVPFPQYGLNAVSMTTAGAHSIYNAGVIELRKRVTRGWGGSFSYTYSRLNDNQIGQFGSGNYLAFAAAPGILDNYSYIPGSPAFNPDVDYGLSLNDMPHKLVLAPIVQLPFGSGRAHLNKGGVLDYLVGGWTVSAVSLIQSGFPIAVTQTPNTTNLNGAGQRPNIVAGADLLAPGDLVSRIQNNPNDNLYLNPAAFALAPAFTLGTAPLRLPGVRSPVRTNTDVAVNKDFRTGGTTRVTLRLEVLNLFNTPFFTRMASASVGNASFAQVTTQGNYSRFAQLTARIQF